MAASRRTLGVLLAGGRGERLKLNRPKALALLEGETLLDRTIAILARACDDVTVAAPRGVELPIPSRIHRIFDSGEGPLSGLVAALASAPFDRAFALSVDFPLMQADVIAFLLNRLESATALVPAPGGRLQPLAAAYAPAAVPLLTRSFEAGERAVTRAVESLAPRVMEDAELVALPGGLENFFNVNTPDDLIEAARRLRARVESG